MVRYHVRWLHTKYQEKVIYVNSVMVVTNEGHPSCNKPKASIKAGVEAINSDGSGDGT